MEEILIVILLPILLLWICSARFTFISATLGPGPSRPASGARAGLVAQNQKDCDRGEGHLDHDGADRQHPEFALCFSVHGWSTFRNSGRFPCSVCRNETAPAGGS
jgi:hypothetical protein